MIREQGVGSAFFAFQKLAHRRQRFLNHGNAWHLSESDCLADDAWKPLLEHVKKGA
jgi:hypothetical protein